MSQEQKSNTREPTIVCFFAHKGGVSKTTNIYHLAWMLVKKYHLSVIVADADPQCNLTHALEPEARNDPMWRDNVENGNIYSAIKGVHSGVRDASQTRMAPAACRVVDRCTEGDYGEHALYLLPGSLELSILERQLSQSLNPSGLPIMQHLPGVFRSLFLSTAAYYKADLVIVDMGPSIGALNEHLFMSSDYFVVPCAADAYSRSTIVTMNTLLPRWNSVRKNLAILTKDTVFPVKTEPTKFLGIIMSLFNVSGKERKPVRQDQSFMDLVEQSTSYGLITTLEEEGMVAAALDANYPTLGRVPNFLQLMQISQRANYPVYCIPPGTMKTLDKEGCEVLMSKSEEKRNSERGEIFYHIYSDMAQKFLDVLEWKGIAMDD